MAGLSVAEQDPPRVPQLTPEQERRRRNRSVALAIVLVALVVIMIAITLVRGPDVILRPL